MKAKDYNGTIKKFINIPKSYGNIMAGFDLLSDEELKTYGFYDIVTPDYNLKIQELGTIYFDSENDVFTYNINNKTWSETLAQLKEKQIEEAKIFARTLLYNTDWYVTRKSEKGLGIPNNIQTERNNIRTTCDNHETTINALNTKAEVVSYNIVY